ncbi:MAG: hypothetical protein LBJ08_00375 [Bifidobacteriaceae bacterium]|jgi:hypothetical protein|nr:hypothetical protein [Bifidobacteriaceae bacterium]
MTEFVPGASAGETVDPQDILFEGVVYVPVDVDGVGVVASLARVGSQTVFYAAADGDDRGRLRAVLERLAITPDGEWLSPAAAGVLPAPADAAAIEVSPIWAVPVDEGGDAEAGAGCIVALAVGEDIPPELADSDYCDTVWVPRGDDEGEYVVTLVPAPSGSPGE